ncbi:hypothetical protein PROFUN_04109 [Planoprotostelium fungivorum]|uniref:Uncharacterized protein n=1 Tax=Planoprotostelium fungivorum TaxID=1890364 RepID=A0A2P6NJI2_9EUKA|nr:hypothetical protein PROFUN_04109 [Planoprotostelium fungivorum]
MKHLLVFLSLAVLATSQQPTPQDLLKAVDGMFSFGVSDVGTFGPGNYLDWQVALAYNAIIDAIDWGTDPTTRQRSARLDNALTKVRTHIPDSLQQNEWNDDNEWYGLMAIRYHETFGDTFDGAFTTQTGINIQSNSFTTIYSNSPNYCGTVCAGNLMVDPIFHRHLTVSQCNAYSWSDNKCYLKSKNETSISASGYTSGVVIRNSTGANYLDIATNMWEKLNPKWIGQGCVKGAMTWKQGLDYFATISSNLNTVVSAKLYKYKKEQKYLDAALASNAFVEKWGRAGRDCVGDGVNGTSCKVNYDCTTYNLGIYIMGLSALSEATGNMSYWNEGYRLAVMEVKNKGWFDSKVPGVLGSPGPDCNDFSCFNGQLVRGISSLFTFNYNDRNGTVIPFLARQAEVIWNRDRLTNNTFGPIWIGPANSSRVCDNQCVLPGLFGGFIPYYQQRISISVSVSTSTADGSSLVPHLTFLATTVGSALFVLYSNSV